MFVSDLDPFFSRVGSGGRGRGSGGGGIYNTVSSISCIKEKRDVDFTHDIGHNIQDTLYLEMTGGTSVL